MHGTSAGWWSSPRQKSGGVVSCQRLPLERSKATNVSPERKGCPNICWVKNGGGKEKGMPFLESFFFLRICYQSAAGFFERESAKIFQKVASKRRHLRENNSYRKHLPTKKKMLKFAKFCGKSFEFSFFWVLDLLILARRRRRPTKL